VPIFHYAGSRKRKRRRTEVTEVTERCTGRDHGMTGRIWSAVRRAGVKVCNRRVRSGAQKELWFARTIERGTRPVTRDRTRPIVEGAYWTLTGRGHCRVRSLTGARPVVASRARGAVRWARSVVDWSASGHLGPARPVVMRSTSGHGV
jgi:hypothetical protein